MRRAARFQHCEAARAGTAPERELKTRWKDFLSQHRDVIVAADFFTIEAWTRKGLTRFLVLFLIDVSSRRVEIAGVTSEGNRLWMSQVARNLSDAAEGFLLGKRYLIHDRDPLFPAEFLKNHSGKWDRIREIAAALAEFECPRQAICPNDQAVLLGTDDCVRRRFFAEGHA